MKQTAGQPQTQANCAKGGTYLTRRRFVRLALLAGGAMGGGAFRGSAAEVGLATRSELVFRIAPLPGVIYGASFARFYRRAKFESFAAAAAAVLDPNVSFRIVAERLSPM